VKHLNDLLEDFLNIGKLEEGKVIAEVDAFDAKEFIQDICEEMKAVTKEGQDIKFSYEGDVVFSTDKRLLKNILINLTSNAIKFSEAGMCVYIDAIHNDGELSINVRDQGIGIPEEDKQHLFSTFFRGKNAVNIQGTGLGLNIVRRYVDLMQGSISVSSELKEGTTFHLCVPLLIKQDSLT
jgi:signal transduction histidine kinase